MPARKLIEAARQRIGNAPISQTARRLDAVLRAAKLDYALVGGYAVQHYGYPRFTSDLDAVVRDRETVRTALVRSGQFKPVQGSQMTVVDRINGVPVDLLSSHQKDSATALPYPVPGTGGIGIRFVTLPELISLKLGARRMKDLADVVELIKANRLDAGFIRELSPQVRDAYLQMHRQATAETS